MANHKSALKRARQNETRRIRNRAGRAAMRTAIKRFETAVTTEGQDATAELRTVSSALALAAKSGVIPRGRASRKIARLHKQLDRSL